MSLSAELAKLASDPALPEAKAPSVPNPKLADAELLVPVGSEKLMVAAVSRETGDGSELGVVVTTPPELPTVVNWEWL